MRKRKSGTTQPHGEEASAESRSARDYPYGSGDRNVWSPFGKERMPIHHGGTQRDPVADSEGGPPDAGKPESGRRPQGGHE